MAERAAKPSRTKRPPAAPSPGQEAEEASSAASSAGSGTSDGFIDDAGPVFDPEAAAEREPEHLQTDEVLPPEAEWETDTIESLLTIKGRVIHAAIGVAEEDWRYTELDLAAIAPPLRRILNRYDATKALAAHADPLVLAAAFGAYVVRSAEERREVLRAIETDDLEEIPPLAEQPINAPPTPPPAPAGAPPPAAPTGSTQHTAPPAPVVQADVDPRELEWKTGTP